MTKEQRTILIQVFLFIATLITTTIAGSEFTVGKSVFQPDYTWSDFAGGLPYSISFLLILTVHEFGHYFMAMYHKVKSSLPYYIPIPPIVFSFGTFGAVIRLRSKVQSTKQNFDIGIAGPLAGFVMAVIILIYGFLNLPSAEHIFQLHPEYKQYGMNYADHVYPPQNGADILVGKNLLFVGLEKLFADPTRMPNPHELIHYPYLFAGLIALLFTAINLLPIGQLDGGHILYGLVGHKRHRIIASAIYVGLIFYAGLGLEYVHPSLPLADLKWSIPLYGLFLYFCFTGLGLPVRDTIMYALLVFAGQYIIVMLYPNVVGYPAWLVLGFVLGRFLGVQHPPSEIEEPLDEKRKILGWVALGILILCFIPDPIQIILSVNPQP